MSIEPGLLLTTSPFLKDRADTAWIMWQVNLSLVPVVLAATWFFGVGALLLVAAATAGAVLPEWLYARGRRLNPVRDGSAVITGVLLALTLPPGFPLWMAFIGGVVAIGLGKIVFGGIGYSIFNPALVGRAFLQAAFPAAITSWSAHGGPAEMATLRGSPFAVPFLQAPVDAVTSATPLSHLKFDGVVTSSVDLLIGRIDGSLGETSALILLLCGLYLAARRVLNWRIPLAVIGTTFVAGTLVGLLDPGNGSGSFHVLAGGLMLGAVFMATDPVTSPITQAGCWLFGIGIGLLVVVIRVWGGLPEGVMYAILFMNAATPIINRITQPRSFGTASHPRWAR